MTTRACAPRVELEDVVRQEEVVELLKRMIRVPSVASRETDVARRIIEVLEREGITEYELIESAPGRGNLVVTLRGRLGDGPTLMIVGHLDVVPAGEGWTVNPFAGEERDGWIYGRGAYDDKGQATVMTYLAVALERMGRPFRGTLRLLFAADEETQSPNHGVRFLARERPDVFRGVSAAIGELGGKVVFGGKEYQVVTIGEKSSAVYEITFRGTGGHSSVPFAYKNPIDTACRSLSRIPDGMFHLSEPVKVMLKELAGRSYALLRVPLVRHIMLRILRRRNPELAGFLHALTHVTFAKTTISGGSADNVIPREVRIVIDVRGFSEQREQDLRRLLTKFVGSKVEVRLKAYTPSTWTVPKHPLYEAICRVIEELGFRPLPFFSVATSDSAWLRCMGMPVFHFFPTKHEVTEFRAHGADERIHREDLMLALEGYLRVVMKFMGEDRA